MESPLSGRPWFPLLLGRINGAKLCKRLFATSDCRKPHYAGSLQWLQGVSHVKNFQIVAFYELEPLAKLFVPDFAFGSLSQQTDHFGKIHVRRRATKLLEHKSNLR